MTHQQHLSGTLDLIRVHRPSAFQKLANQFLPKSRKLLGRVVHEQRGIKNLILNKTLAYGGPPPSFDGTNKCFFKLDTSTAPNFRIPAVNFSVIDDIILRSDANPALPTEFVVGEEVKLPSGERFHIVEILAPHRAKISKYFTTILGSTSEAKFYNTAYFSNSTLVYESATPNPPIKDYVLGRASKSWSVTTTPVASAVTVGSVVICLEDFSSYLSSARVVLPQVINLLPGDQLTMQYTLRIEASGRETKTVALSSIVSGYPVQYSASSISQTTGSSVDIALTADHHFLVGDQIVIGNAGAHNGIFTVATLIGPKNIRVNSTVPGSASQSGNPFVTSQDIATETVYGGIFEQRYIVTNDFLGLVLNETQKVSIPPVSRTYVIDTTSESFIAIGNTLGAIPSFANDYVRSFAPDPNDQWLSGGPSVNRVKQINIGNAETGQQRLIEFHTAQPKLTTHKMKLPTYRVQMIRDLD